MCLLCDDEKAYQAYMDYLDQVEAQGKAANPDAALDAALSAAVSGHVADTTLSVHTPSLRAERKSATRKSFSCDPVDE